MTDDQREILKAAGVECAEVAVWQGYAQAQTALPTTIHFADAAILALARLVAKYKWQRDHVPAINGELFDRDQWSLDELDRLWDKLN